MELGKRQAIRQVKNAGYIIQVPALNTTVPNKPYCFTKPVSRFGLTVRRQAGKWKDLGSIPLRLSFLFKKAVVCGHVL